MGLGTYVWPISVTTPPLTLPAAPLSTPPMIGDIWIDKVELQIPPGHNGLTGIYVANGSTAILPYSQVPQFLIATDELLEYDVGDQFGRSLAVVTYNTDVLPHTHYLRISGRYMVQVPNAVIPTADVIPIS